MRTASGNNNTRSPAWCCAIIAMLFGIVLPARARIEQRNLLAHGAGRIDSTSPIWVARSDSRSQQESTVVLLRSRVGETDWLQISRIPARALAMTSYRGELVVLLSSDGQAGPWMIVSNRSTFGASIPGHGEMMAIAGDYGSLWALGRPGSGPSAGTRPAATRAATGPTTSPSARPVLYQSQGDTWKPQSAEWPADIEVTPLTGFSMALIGPNGHGRPTVAVSASDGVIHLIQFDGTRWQRLQRVALACTHFKLLNLQDRLALWCQDPQSSIGGIWRPGDGKLVKLSLSGQMPQPADVDVAAAGDDLSLFCIRGDHVIQQRYSVSDLRESGRPIDVQARMVRTDDQFQYWVTIAVMAVLSILILNIILRRRAAGRDEDDIDDDSEER